MTVRLEDLKKQAISTAKEEMRERLSQFSKTPIGRVIQKAGKRVIEAKESGEDLTPLDLVSFCLEVPDMLNEDDE